MLNNSNLTFQQLVTVLTHYVHCCFDISVGVETLFAVTIGLLLCKESSRVAFSLVNLFLQAEDHRPMWYIHTITGEHRYKHRYNL